MMKDSEIVSRYQKMTGRSNRRIKILAELNDCGKEYIEGVLFNNGISMTEKKPAAGRRKKKQKVPDAIIQAVRDRMTALEEQTKRVKEVIDGHQQKFDGLMQEWAELREWQQEHDPQSGTDTI